MSGAAAALRQAAQQREAAAIRRHRLAKAAKLRAAADWQAEGRQRQAVELVLAAARHWAEADRALARQPGAAATLAEAEARHDLRRACALAFPAEG